MLTARATTLHLPLLLTLCLFSIQGTSGRMCISCIDTGDGRCSEAEGKECPDPNDACVQALTTVNISFASLFVLSKGCGSNVSSESPIEINGEAIATATQIEVCNTKLCNNRRFDAAQFPLVSRTMNTSTANTSVECYSCIGITREECANDRAANLSCAGDACAEGSLELRLRNLEFLTVFFKDCGSWGAFHSIEPAGHAELQVNVTRSVCTGRLCNQEHVPPTVSMRTPSTPSPKSGSNLLTSSHLLLALVLTTVLI